MMNELQRHLEEHAFEKQGNGFPVEIECRECGYQEESELRRHEPLALRRCSNCGGMGRLDFRFPLSPRYPFIEYDL